MRRCHWGGDLSVAFVKDVLHIICCQLPLTNMNQAPHDVSNLAVQKTLSSDRHSVEPSRHWPRVESASIARCQRLSVKITNLGVGIGLYMNLI